jgi:hypothetical protein
MSGEGARLHAGRDFAQLQLHFVDRLQWRYELIRPLVLFADRTPKQRAEETQTYVETVRDLTRRFQKQGILGLLPDEVILVPKGKATRVPPAVVEELARLKTLYTGRSIYHTLSRVKSGGSAASLLVVTGLIAYNDGSLVDSFSCS